MANRESILQAIDELESRLEQMESEEVSFSEGDVVNYSHEGNEGVAMIESMNEGQATIRVMAVAGDSYEPTDDVYTLNLESLSVMAGDEEPTEEEAEEEEIEEEPEEESEDEEIKKGAYVKFLTKAGEVIGLVVDVDKSIVVIPETGSQVACKSGTIALIEVYENHEGWEDTGVHVAHPTKSLEVIRPIEVKLKRVMVKLRKVETILDEEEGLGILKGVGSPYGKVDLGGDSIAQGAYTQTINHNEGKVQLMFDHGYRVDDVAGIAELEDTEEGLMVTAKMPLHIPHIRAKYEINRFMVEQGKPLGFSIGYRAVKSDYMENGVRLIKEIALEEMTITPYPMETYARIQEAKSRKIAYHSKRRDWQTLSTPKEIDAPTSNQPRQGDYKSLVSELQELKQKINEVINV